MKKDFCDYEDDGVVCPEAYELSSGASKTTKCRVIISTWSMLLKCQTDFYESFECFICDESHQASSEALGRIISNLNYVPYRFGFTGTLDGSKTHEMQCRSWFGPLIKSSTTKELMDRSILAPMEIQSLEIRYSEDDCKKVSKMDYPSEITFLVEHEKRNDFLIELAMKQDNNTILLFNLVDKHGLKIYQKAKNKAEQYGKQVHFISGTIDGNEREEIRQLMENNKNVILFASFGTMSVGVNIKNLHYIIFAHPYKAKIRTLQSIGRSLRKHDTKDKAIIYDISDNLCYKKHKNFAYKHSMERLKIYNSEGFMIKNDTIELYDT